MPTIRHICDGHEYRYDIDTGVVTNNYGTEKSVLRFAKFVPDNVTAITSLWPLSVLVRHTAAAKPYATMRWSQEPTDTQLAEFAIGQTAAHLPEMK